MKNFYSLLKILLFIPFFAVFANAQINPEYDPEKIYLFDCGIVVNTDGTISVTETITLNARHEQIRRGIYRDFPNTYSEKPIPLSLKMDGKEHPFFTEKTGRNMRVNFGNDDYISQGVHTYIFKYNYEGAINFHKNYDEIYWNITGNNWDFPIDKAKVNISFPPEIKVLKDGISLYTGKFLSKANNTVATSDFSFETTTPLAPYEGITIAVPFEKGVIAPPQAISKVINSIPLIILALVVLISIILFIYFIITWIAVGIDPVYKIVPQYQPPQGVSPAFLKYLYTNGTINADMFACSILHLAMQGYIQIKQSDKNKVELTLLREDTDKLPEDEKIIIQNFFSTSKTYTLKPYSAHGLFAIIKSQTEKIFAYNAKPYIKENASYINFACRLLTISILLPALFVLAKGIVLCLFNYDLPDLSLNLFSDYFAEISSNFVESSVLLSFIGTFFCFLFNCLIIAIAKSNTGKSGQGCNFGCLLMFFSIFLCIFLFMQQALLPWVCQAVFMITATGFAIYARYIGNVTEEGKEMFFKIYGFKHYLKKAEKYRVAASSPLEQEKVFCDFLPYAFAFNMQNQWIKKFENLLSQAVIQQCTQRAGGTQFITGSFVKHISRSSSAQPSSSSGSGHSSHSGSFGGGHSGGGHGSSGGGGR